MEKWEVIVSVVVGFLGLVTAIFAFTKAYTEWNEMKADRHVIETLSARLSHNSQMIYL